MAKQSWESVRLGELVSIKHGWPFKSNLFSEELTGRPIVVAVGNFQYTGGFRFDSTNVKEYRGTYPAEYDLSPDDVLLVMTCQTPGGEILGIPARVPNDGRHYLHNQRLGKVVVKHPKRVSLDYLYWLFLWKDFNTELVASSSGTKIVHTAPSRIEAFRFDLPPLTEQRAIARVLRALDNKIELNRRMNRTLEDLARGLFQSWFVDFDPVTKNYNGKAPTAFTGLFPKRLVDSSQGLVPEGWRVGQLGDWCNINARSVTRQPCEGEFGYIDISSVSRGALDGPRRVLWKEAPSRAQRLVQHGDTLWSCVRPNLEAYLLMHRPAADWVASTGFVVLTPGVNARSFIYLATTQPEFIDYLVARAEGSAYPAVRPDVFTQAPMIVPPHPVMAKFESIVGPWIERCGQNQQESKRLAALRDALLPQLLSGEVRLVEASRLVKEVVA